MNLLEHALATWMPAQRWFPGDRIGGDVTVIEDTLLAAGDPELRHLIVSVRSGAPAGGPARYQVLAGFRRQIPAELAHAVIGTDQRGKVVYDGLHDSKLTAVLLRAIAGERAVGPLAFAREPDVAIDLTARSLVLSVEQSNTSLVFGDSAILKVFRRLFTGSNPDLEINSALARLGSSDIARPLGSVSSRLDGEPVLLAVLSEFQRGACDGWQLALTSLRDLYARATDLVGAAADGESAAVAEAGGDFAGEAHRLGAATARVHADLARAFGTQTLDPEELAGLAGQMALKLKEASAEVPELATFADKVATAYAALAEVTGPVTVQRVHGDYHLGQVLRSQSGWVLLDFEGEPLVPLDRRRDLAPALRDVAGMLRSLDYAARHLLVGHPDAARLSGTALEWVARNSAAFCEGYAEEHGSDPRDQAILLRALMLDKAVYEVMYEARHRPSWQGIPLDAIAGL
jgi:maltokinase